MTKGKCCTHLQKKTKRISRELQTGHPHLGPWENCRANPLGAHFQAHESGDDWEQSAWI